MLRAGSADQAEVALFLNRQESVLNTKLLCLGTRDLGRLGIRRLYETMSVYAATELGRTAGEPVSAHARTPNVLDLIFLDESVEPYGAYGFKPHYYALDEMDASTAWLDFLLPGTDGILFFADADQRQESGHREAMEKLGKALTRRRWSFANVPTVVAITGTNAQDATPFDDLSDRAFPEDVFKIDVDAIDADIGIEPDALPGLFIANHFLLGEIRNALDGGTLVQPPLL